MRMRGTPLTQPSPTEGRGHNVMRQRRIWRPSWSGGDTRRTGQGPAAERDSLRREPAMQCFRLCLTVLSRRRRTVSLNLLMTPMVRKFPVGRWAVYLGFLPDVKYSVGNGRADGQRVGVIVFSWIHRIHRMISICWDRDILVCWCILLCSGGGTAKGEPKGLRRRRMGGGIRAGGGASVEVAWR